MPETDEIRMPLTSTDVLGQRIDQLRELFPEAFTEGKIDFERLRQALGDEVDTRRERYGLSWAGKAEAIRNIQTFSVGTLLPCPEESVNFDTSGNLFIEGDNLEVLKLLQKSYYGKVKMIYIDPPYNTGGEFIYPDNYREGLEDYLRYSGQVNDAGVRQSTNTETGGRYHSKWLSMMAPRLFLARNLLRDDGVIFISIDDHEVHDLRLLMDELFGSENFLATIVWQKVFSPKNTARHFSEDHDYVVTYARDADQWTPELLPRTEEMEARYSNPDEDTRGPWASSDLCARNYYSEGTYSITCPSGRVIEGPPTGTYWRVKKAKFLQLDAEKRIYWGPDGNNMPRLKRFLSEVKEGLVPQTLWKHQDVGHTQEAKKCLLAMVPFASSDSVFDTPKPPRLIERMLRITTRSSESDLVLDFFAGSGTTGEAVMRLNGEDNGNRRFILVQLPEPTGAEDFRTIAEIAKTRLRNSGKKLSETEDGSFGRDQGAAQDRGFKVFKLSSSNFKIWESDKVPANAEEIGDQLRLFADHVLQERTEQSILFELMLKAGLPLTAKIQTTTAAGNPVYSIADGMLLICLTNPITQECLRGMIGLQPQRIVCLDPAFQGNDQLKTNTVLEMKTHGIEFRTV